MASTVRNDVPLAPIGTSPSVGDTTAASLSPTAPKYFRVMVDGTDHKDGRPVHVNMRIPIKLLRFGMRFATFLPPQAKQQVNEALREQGLGIDVNQIKPEDINELITELQDVSIDIHDEKEDVKVRMFVE